MESSAAHTVILASAGTGKTHRLSSEFLRHLFQGRAVDRILATTFTRKAAGEIFDRIVSRLLAAATNATDRAQLSQEIGQPLTAGACRGKLAELTHNLHRVRVATLDAFLAELAHSFALEVDLPPGWEIIDNGMETTASRHALAGVLQELGERASRELVFRLNKGDLSQTIGETLESVVGDTYRLFLEAEPAGEAAWSWMPRPNPPDSVDLQEALTALRRGQSDETRPWSDARQKIEALYVEGRDEEFLRETLTRRIHLRGDYYRRSVDSDFAAAVAPLISAAVADMVHRVGNQVEGGYRLLVAYHRLLQLRKQTLRMATFDDVSYSMARLARRAAHSSVAYRLDGRIDCLLLDEFQDTSVAQWNVLLPLARHITSTIDGRTSFFCVGDTKQAIYGWRGGTSTILTAMANQLPNVGTESLNLNRRSAQPIIDTVNQVFTNAARHADLEQAKGPIRDWCKAFATHTTNRNVSGYAELRGAPKQNGKDGSLEEVARLATELHQQTSSLEIGILTRGNSAVAALIHLFRTQGVAASEEGESKLTDSAAVQVVLSALRLGLHPGHTGALYHVLHSPLAAAFGRQWNGATKEADARDLSQQIRGELFDHGYGGLLTIWTECLRPRCSSHDLLRLEQLADLAYTFQSRGPRSINDFLRHVEEYQRSDPATSRIRVMTVHQAKGLEFDCVIVTDLDDSWSRNLKMAYRRNRETHDIDRIGQHVSKTLIDYLPASMQEVCASDRRWRLGEELCILYVALTRARQGLYIVIPEIGNKPRTTLAGLTHHALAPNATRGQTGTLYRHGDADWLSAFQAKQRETRATQRITVPATIALAPAAASQSETVRTASQAKPRHRIRLGSLLSSDRQQAMSAGSLMHAWLESIGWLPEDQPDHQALVEIARLQRYAARSLEALTDRFLALLASPSLQRILNQSAYRSDAMDWLSAHASVDGPWELEALNERPVATTLPAGPVTGVIDRLILWKSAGSVRAADIIDYKTDQLDDDARATALAQEYAAQIDAYRQAIQRNLNLPPECVRGRLLFVQRGILMEPEPGPPEATPAH